MDETAALSRSGLGEPGPEAILKHYFFYIHDRRYTVPQFVVIDAADDDDAAVRAKKYLADSTYYLAIDIVDGEREVARIDR
jgi:hypothetical protein